MSCTTTKTTLEKKNTSAVDFKIDGTLSEIIDQAEKENKLVFVDFYTDWCLPCKMMDQDVFSDLKLARALNEDFVSYKVNAEKNNGPNLAFLYQVQAYPTLVFLDHKGNVLVRKEGAAYHTEFFEMMNKAKTLSPL